ncbi:hypothetical protein [Bailinhaonella thermotolerans]|uniref:Uncharacterized protein n=1 Tax=Bailinhaonella thermotolerans TaxID=1070861 RepID=A0A3A4A7X4_9ACTN|nr:hypothetical protein [Bailinhaonella thermotolerans]RJL21096.1 hypothetical protein D5H75_38445 [Bailinhaonella thermotolerans]
MPLFRSRLPLRADGLGDDPALRAALKTLLSAPVPLAAAVEASTPVMVAINALRAVDWVVASRGEEGAPQIGLTEGGRLKAAAFLHLSERHRRRWWRRERADPDAGADRVHRAMLAALALGPDDACQLASRARVPYRQASRMLTYLQGCGWVTAFTEPEPGRPPRRLFDLSPPGQELAAATLLPQPRRLGQS